MAWAGSTRRARLPRDWARIRRRIIRRDRACVWRMTDGSLCGAEGTDVDHIVAGDDHSDGNLQLFCSWHHARKSSQEGNAGTRVTARRPSESHPALDD
ncbi:HNH endonuclease [Streptomyces sp. SM8]|jgi:5-methylcytosine-specific restriction endonuclease McrA|nr:HNH endonuclease [Streptomyces sp. SM8]